MPDSKSDRWTVSGRTERESLMGSDDPMLCDVSGLAGVNGLTNPFYGHLK